MGKIMEKQSRSIAEALPEVGTLLAGSLNMDIPKLYANSLGIALGGADLALILQYQNQPIAVVNISLQTAKSMAKGIADAVEHYEKVTETRIISLSEADALFSDSPGD
jgi:hypothetical protein